MAGLEAGGEHETPEAKPWVVCDAAVLAGDLAGPELDSHLTRHPSASLALKPSDPHGKVGM